MKKHSFRKVLSLVLAIIYAIGINAFSMPIYAAEKGSDVTVIENPTELYIVGDKILASTPTNGFIWSGTKNFKVRFTKTMKSVTYHSVIGLNGKTGVVNMNFDHLNDSGTVNDWKAFTFACDGDYHTSSNFASNWPSGTYNVTVTTNTAKKLSNLFVTFNPVN